MVRGPGAIANKSAGVFEAGGVVPSSVRIVANILNLFVVMQLKLVLSPDSYEFDIMLVRGR